jgi:hypothetical protein
MHNSAPSPLLPSQIIIFDMTKLLAQAIDALRQLPEDMQDAAARALIFRLDNEMEIDDR